MFLDHFVRMNTHMKKHSQWAPCIPETTTELAVNGTAWNFSGWT